MVMKAKVRNEHHDLYRRGIIDEIPADILALLREQHPELEGGKVEKEPEDKE